MKDERNAALREGLAQVERNQSLQAKLDKAVEALERLLDDSRTAEEAVATLASIKDDSNG